MVGRSPKLQAFHADLGARGIARPFAGEFTAKPYDPVAETDRAAAELLRRYDGSR
jgi:mitochondrial fission protein ELM1